MNNDLIPNPPAADPDANTPETAPDQKPVSPRSAFIGLAILLAVALLLAGLGIVSRMHASKELGRTTDEQAAPTVIVHVARQGAAVNSFSLPGNVTAYTDSPVYARTSGYLTRWHYDIGSRVKKGALLAEIASPEIDQQLLQAEAELGTAEANAANAKTQAERYSGLVKSEAVSRQDTETYVNQAAATAASVRSAQANVRRLHNLQSFEKVYAPFDGVVTARNVDTGQLIETGTGKELFHMQATQTLRVYTNVPESVAGSIHVGDTMVFTVAEHPGKNYLGKLVRTAEAMDPSSRTLLVELDIDNRRGELLPGSLAQVQFKTAAGSPSLVVPAAALIFRREGLRVATVTGDVAHLVPVIIGQDDGATVQIIHGLSATDAIIQDPPDSLIDGERVRVVAPSTEGK